MIIFLFGPFETVTGVPEIFGYVLAVILGGAIGSFLNVVIHRVPRGTSIVFPNSACPKCGAQIAPYDNIPVVSWLVLGGRCRSCKASISIRYPAVEALTASIFALVYWQVGFTPLLPVALVFVSAILALIFIDAEHMILPNVITYPLFFFGLAVRAAAYPLSIDHRSLGLDLGLWPFPLNDAPEWSQMVLGGVIGAVIGGGLLWLIGAMWKALRGVDAMGLGDVKMMAAVGMMLGWRLTLLATFIGFFGGAIVGGMMVARRGKDGLQAQIPFGIFLGVGTIVALLFGERLLGWYLGTFVY